MPRKNNLFKLTPIALSLSLFGCSVFQTRDEIARENHVPKKQGSSIEETAPALQEKVENKKVAIVLGPGGYKAFAHAGVIKELRKHNIPIHKIVGLEWGALVAGLYAQRGQINEAEWKLYKLEHLDLESTGFFGRKKETQSLKILDDYLKQNLDGKDVAQATVPFFCPSLNVNQGTLDWQDTGPVAQAVRNCLAFPPLFESNQALIAGLFAVDEAVQKLKSEGYGVVILVNVLGDGNLFDNKARKDDYSTVVLWNEVRRAVWRAKSMVSDVIEVPTRGISMADFSSRKLLVTAGEAAGDKAAKAIAEKYGF